MPTRLATKGDMTSRGVLSVVFKIPKCTSHLGIGLACKSCLTSRETSLRSRSEVGGPGGGNQRPQRRPIPSTPNPVAFPRNSETGISSERSQSRSRACLRHGQLYSGSKAEGYLVIDHCAPELTYSKTAGRTYLAKIPLLQIWLSLRSQSRPPTRTPRVP